MDNQRIGRGNIKPRFHDGRGQQHIILALVKAGHDAFKLGGRHLPVRHGHFGFGHLAGQEIAGLLDILDTRADIKALAAAIALAQQGLADDQRIERGNKTAHGQPVHRRGGNHRQFAHPCQRQLQGARNRGGRQRQHMHRSAHFLQALFVVDAEMLFFVDDQQGQITEGNGFAQQRMGADHDIDSAVCQPFFGLGQLFGGHEARGLTHHDGQTLEAFGKVSVMLAGEQGGGYHKRDLTARNRRHKSRPQRHFRLAEADIAADQPVHRMAGSQIIEHRINGALLVLGFVIDETGGKFLVKPLGGDQFGGLVQRAGGGNLDQSMRHLADALLHFGLAGLPCPAAQPVKRGIRIFRAVARQQFQIFHRQKQPVAARIMQLDAIMGRARRLDVFQADKTADPVLDMHHQIARRQRADFGNHILRTAVALGAAHQTVAQNILLGYHHQPVGLEAAFEPPDHGCGFARLQSGNFGEARHRFERFDAVIVQHAGNALARAFRPSRHHHPPLCADVADMSGHHIENIDILARFCPLALGREGAAQLPARIHHQPLAAVGMIKRGQPDDRHIRLRPELFGPLRLVEIEADRRHGLIGRGARLRGGHGRMAGIVMVVDRGNALQPRLLHQRIKHQRAVGDIVEQRIQPVMEQRQPMFQPRIAATFADRLIKRIGRSGRAELGDIGLPEPLDGLAGQLHFAHRHQIKRAHLADRTLRFGVEGADGFQRIAEKIEPDRMRQTGRIQIDNAAAHGIFTGFTHGRPAQIAVMFEPDGQRLNVDHIARRAGKGLCRHFVAARHPLHQTVGRHNQQPRLVGPGFRARQPRQHRHAPRHNRPVGRNTVIGLAIPIGEGQHFKLGRDKGHARLELGLTLGIAGHHHQRGSTFGCLAGERTGQIRQYQGIEAIGHAGQSQLLPALNMAQQTVEKRLHQVSFCLEGNRSPPQSQRLIGTRWEWKDLMRWNIGVS